MLFYERSIQVPELGVELTQRALMSPVLRIYELTTRGVVVERGLLGHMGVAHDARIQGNFVLEGTLKVRRPEQPVFIARRGEVFWETNMRWNERWEGEPFRAICVDWERSEQIPRRVASISEESLSKLEALRLSRAQDTHPSVVCEIWEMLEEEGFERFDRRHASMRASPELQRIADAFGKAMSQLHTQPQWCDFTDELGMSERHLRRHLSEVLSWFPFLTDEVSFRAVLNRTRMHRAVTLMTAKGATVAKVAALLGYSSSVAFSNACCNAGMGRPSTFARRVAQLS